MDGERFENVYLPRLPGNQESPAGISATPSRRRAMGIQPKALEAGECVTKARLIWLSPSDYQIREPRTRSPRGNSDPGKAASNALVTMTGDADSCR